jgi:hypothetical protein
MRQILSALFWSLNEYYPAWNNASESQPVPTLGVEYDVTFDSVRVNRKRWFEMFRSGVADLEPVLASILTAPTLEELKRCAGGQEATTPPYSDELWAKTVFEYAASYHRGVINRDHIIQALVPLYRGRVHTFMEQTRGASAQALEQNIEGLCRTFEQLKPNLLASWTSQEGGS